MMKILIAASEAVPFAKTGGLADVAGALPLALEEIGAEVVVCMPHYKAVQDVLYGIKKLRADISYTTLGKGIKVYFLDNEGYFYRDGLYGDKNGDHKDNLERFSFYCRRTLELLKEINFQAEIIHCHDWQSALIPVYLKTAFKDKAFYRTMRTVLTIHNIGYQGLFSREEFPKLGLGWALFNLEGLEFYGQINILKGGVVFSDIINTVSPTYSQEIQSKEFGFGLEGLLNKRSQSLFGILNGLDYSIWDPQTDKFIAKNYSSQTIADKAKDKQDLQESCKLPLDDKIPLFGIVSRLAEQKGFDILAEAMEELCRLRLQLVILGTGDKKYHQLLDGLSRKYPKKISLHLKFDDPLAHKIYAGADIFLMPSKYEPCGLGQLISLRYATVPLVFKTGGLADTVNKENGFVFTEYSCRGLLEAVKEALRGFADKAGWARLRQKAMACNFSWEASARQYLALYEKAKRPY